ncbi:MAG: M56 family metallopeptidase [Gemmatimonadetes bacterium]|nr:M56 family metallopeptidase [Gemmatimonadota bacterium]
MLPPLVRREQRHRRWLLVSLAVLLLLSISPVVGHHLVSAVPWLPASRQHLGIFCLVALHHLLAPVHTAFHAMLYLGIAYMVVDRARAARRHARVLRSLPAPSLPVDAALQAAVVRAGLDASRVRVIDGLPNPAFTTGWWRPRVYVAGDLSQRLSPDELAAVLAHEAEHVRRRDPLRLFALRSLAGVLFWLPAMRRLAEDLADEAEITADDAAAERFALPLASAILRLAGAPVDGVEPAVGFQRGDLLPRRIKRLAGVDVAASTHVSRGSLGVAGTALVLAWASGLMVLHPLVPSTDPSAHCEHRGAWAITHLICVGRQVSGGATLCAHSSVLRPSTSS